MESWSGRPVGEAGGAGRIQQGQQSAAGGQYSGSERGREAALREEQAPALPCPHWQQDFGQVPPQCEPQAPFLARKGLAGSERLFPHQPHTLQILNHLGSEPPAM